MNITTHIAGKTIEAAFTDGSSLMLRTTDGHEYRIKWVDDEPHLVGIDVKIKVSVPALFGAANIQ